MKVFKIKTINGVSTVVKGVPPNKQTLELMRLKLDEVDKGLKLLQQFYGNPKFNI